MLQHPTTARLEALGFHGMARALEDQAADAAARELCFEDRLAMMVDREAAWRDTKRYQARLRHAKLRVQASIEDIDFKAPRGLDRTLVLRLAEGRWIADGINLIVTGPTGSGKTWLACAFGHRAARARRATNLRAIKPNLSKSLPIAASL